MAMHPSTNLLCVLRPRYSISPVGVERSLSPEVAFSLRKSHPVHLLKLHRSWRNALNRQKLKAGFRGATNVGIHGKDTAGETVG
jgi:hypothetical protein